MINENGPQRNRPLLSIRIRMAGSALLFFSALFALMSLWVHNFGVPILINAATNGQGLSADAVNTMIAAAQVELQTTALVVFFIGLVIVLVFNLNSANVISAPLRQLTQYAQKIANADYSPTEIRQGPFFDDEITTLTQVFMQMVAKVREREESLKKQVVEFQISIDEVKRAHEVEEITNTEFFAQLKEEAQAMRARSRDSRQS